MNDTQPMAPTDDEIHAVVQACRERGLREFDVFRAVLAKWGTTKKELQVGCEGSDGLLRIHAESETCDVCRAHAHAQAGAVPLTDEQIEALPMWKRFVGLWPETRREIVRTIEHHHGIKGGQHGTE